MATYYVWSGATGAGTGADWANAFTNIAAARASGAAGDTVYVADDHAYSTSGADYLIDLKGDVFTPDYIICVRRSGGSVPPVAADIRDTATETITSQHTIGVTGGRGVMYGINFIAGNGTTNGYVALASGYGNCFCKFYRCSGYINGTSDPNANIGVSQTTGAELYDFQVRFSHANNVFFANLSVYIEGGSTRPFVHPSSVVGTVFMLDQGLGRVSRIRGLDLSNVGSGKSLFLGGYGNCKAILFEKCIIDNAVNRTSSTPRFPIKFIGCSAAGVNGLINEIHDYRGVLTTEQTILRTAGATDGTYPFSWKIVTNGNCNDRQPFETFEGEFWNETTGSSKTLTIHTVTDNVTLKDNEIWVEAWYFDGTPVLNAATDWAGLLSSGSNQASDSGEAWTTTGLTTPVKQKLEVTFTPAKKGPIRWIVKVAKASTTVYVCPKADLT
jgi:hypothetical protein